MSATDTTMLPRRPWVAFFLSLLLPGLGQFYCGRWLAAVLFYSPLLVLAFLHRLIVSLEWPPDDTWMVAAAAFLLAVAAAAEAAQVARRLTRYEPTAFNRWYFYMPAVLWNLVVIVCIAGLSNYIVPTGSMGPTIVAGDYILTMSYSSLAGAPRRCDVAVFVRDRGGRRFAFVNRVIALSGDTIAYRNGRLVIDGVVADREKLGETVNGAVYRETLPGGCSHQIEEESDLAPLDNTAAVTVPPGMAFVLGDNRDDSLDSRTESFGPVPLAKFRGKVFMIYMAKDHSRVGWLAH